MPGYSAGIFFSITFSFSYLLIILGSFLFGLYDKYSNKKFFYFGIISFLPIFFYAFIKNQRTAILFAILIFFSTFLSTRIYLRKINKINYNKILFFSSIFMIVILLYFQLQKLRVTSISEENLLQYYQSAISGSFFSFLNWFDKYIFYFEEITLGEYTFNRIHYYFVGNLPKHPGLFGDVFWMDSSFRSGTTIYTLFRSLIYDFGVIGSFLIYFLFGYLSAFFYNQLKIGNILFLPLTSLTFLIITFSYLTSVLNWNSIILAYFIATLIFATIKLKQNEQK
jgi:oligosaccharide repeat unit polymerase